MAATRPAERLQRLTPAAEPEVQHLDGLRALMALCVFFSHAIQLLPHRQLGFGDAVVQKAGEAAVVVFFALSGFLLFRPFVLAHRNGREISIGGYALRRVARVGPAYWAALTVFAIYPGLPGLYSAHSWTIYTFTYQWIPGLTEDGLPVAWSMCVEVAFYALLPGLAWLILRRVTDPSRAFVRLAAAVLASVVAGEIARKAGYFPLRHYLLVTPFPPLAAGMALALLDLGEVGQRVRRATEALARWISLSWLIAASAVVALAFLAPIHSVAELRSHRADLLELMAALVLWTLIGTLTLGPLVVGATPRSDPIRALLRSRGMSRIGVISYGVYVIHVPVLEVLSRSSALRSVPIPHILTITAAALLVTLVGASASWLLLERPSIAWSKRRRVQASPTSRPDRLIRLQ